MTKHGLVDLKGWPEPYIYTYIYTVYLVISKPKIPYVHRIYMVLANPIDLACQAANAVAGDMPMTSRLICRVGQNRIYAPYMTVYLVTSLPKTPYIRRIYGSGQPYLYVSDNVVKPYHFTPSRLQQPSKTMPKRHPQTTIYSASSGYTVYVHVYLGMSVLTAWDAVYVHIRANVTTYQKGVHQAYSCSLSHCQSTLHTTTLLPRRCSTTHHT